MDTLRALLTARLTQLLTRAVTFVLVGLFGADLAAGDAGVSTIVTALVATVLAAADVLIHRTRWGQSIEGLLDPAVSAKQLLVLACVLTPLGATACGCGASSGFYNGVKTQWEVIGPEYRGYVAADPTLGPDARTQVLRSADVVDALIAAEGKKPVALPAPATQPTQPTGSPVPPPPAP